MTELAFPKELPFTKTSESKECDICHYWYFLDKGLTLLRTGCFLCITAQKGPVGFFKITRETSNRNSITHVRFHKQYYQFQT